MTLFLTVFYWFSVGYSGHIFPFWVIFVHFQPTLAHSSVYFSILFRPHSSCCLFWPILGSKIAFIFPLYSVHICSFFGHFLTPFCHNFCPSLVNIKRPFLLVDGYLFSPLFLCWQQSAIKRETWTEKLVFFLVCAPNFLLSVDPWTMRDKEVIAVTFTTLAILFDTAFRWVKFVEKRWKVDNFFGRFECFLDCFWLILDYVGKIQSIAVKMQSKCSQNEAKIQSEFS